ncbi:hypothetical protein WA026_001740 [Henosepilachna vigintioctopunctata]|uniref:Uncharacterized protein n=1 Tax=Henosepilachna vigintioctopunctata TaxID=420089 RepID=A0AAW1USQ2_9CUCU
MIIASFVAVTGIFIGICIRRCSQSNEEYSSYINKIPQHDSRSPISHEVKSLKEKLRGLLHQVETRKPEYTAAGFFTINYSLVARIGALVTSEVVVIIQCVNDKKDC